MFWKKCEKKGHPYLALMIGALAFVGAITVKKSGMQFIKQKWSKLCSAMKNMSMCGSGGGEA